MQIQWLNLIFSPNIASSVGVISLGINHFDDEIDDSKGR
jgi:hypothetical protein